MYRFAYFPRSHAARSGFRYALLCFLVSFATAPAAAQHAASSSANVAQAATASPALTSSAALAQVTLEPPQFVRAVAPEPARRPKPLIPLYVSFASLQAMDIHSTTRALGRGAVEANPLMRGVAGNPLALSAVKMAGAAGVIYAAEKMWKKKRKAAVIFMTVANAGMALIVQHNYRVVK